MGAPLHSAFQVLFAILSASFGFSCTTLQAFEVGILDLQGQVRQSLSCAHFGAYLLDVTAWSHRFYSPFCTHQNGLKGIRLFLVRAVDSPAHHRRHLQHSWVMVVNKASVPLYFPFRQEGSHIVCGSSSHRAARAELSDPIWFIRMPNLSCDWFD